MSNPSATETPTLHEVQGIYGIFCDAVVTDAASNLVFTSLWGRDTAVQELLARLTVSVGEGGLDSFAVVVSGRRLMVYPRDVERLGKHTGRMPKGNLFGEMVNLWLFDPITLEPDRVNRRAILLGRDAVIDQNRLWQLVRDVCHLPLLDSWQSILMSTFVERDWVKPMPHCIGISAMLIELGSEEVETLVGELIRAGRLTAA